MNRLRKVWLAIAMLCAVAAVAFATDEQQRDRGQDEDRRPRVVIRVPKEGENQERGNNNSNRGNQDNDRNRENRDRGRRP